MATTAGLRATGSGSAAGFALFPGVGGRGVEVGSGTRFFTAFLVVIIDIDIFEGVPDLRERGVDG
jgi:hypothetical protein